ncbi:MAG: hypothetical protein OCU22_10120 [Canidatus Methanoxibalbensis ujae]|nr:hypothetical protein [Candidatus Methanoxibalbensis ujae]
MSVWELDKSELITFGQRRGYAVKLYEYSFRGRKGRFLTIEQYEAMRDDYLGEYINRRKSQVTVPNAEIARRIARELFYFAEQLEQSQGDKGQLSADEERDIKALVSDLLGERKMNENGAVEPPQNERNEEQNDEQRTSFRPKVHNRPPSESSTGEEGAD